MEFFARSAADVGGPVGEISPARAACMSGDQRGRRLRSGEAGGQSGGVGCGQGGHGS